jgi:hypothetical protein
MKDDAQSAFVIHDAVPFVDDDMLPVHTLESILSTHDLCVSCQAHIELILFNHRFIYVPSVVRIPL